MDHPGPVTPADVRTAVALAVDTLTAAADDDHDWQIPASGLTWTCWETVEHIADDLFSYAGQLATATPPMTSYVSWGWKHRDGGPALTVYADPDGGVTGLLQVLDSCGGLLAATAQVTPADRRAYHPMGMADAEGFAAMGLVETLVHVHDVAAALGLAWNPPADLCDRVLWRLFPDAPLDTERWPTLLWATGRGELPGHPLLSQWRWDANPRQAAAR
ncbi:hypothetical protein FB565_003920 [Actinoplanes lutulentus]|nr:hypothetical protein [Actinoplanes lutulentus]MBB2944191.1 hypothetical protein [Actinoplanes lutulentus]